jgi:hypothetical protein
MDGTTTPGKILSPFVMQRLGEVLRGRYTPPPTLPSRLYDLMMQLQRHEGSVRNAISTVSVERQSFAFRAILMIKEDDYLHSATETVQLVQRASTAANQGRLMRLAEAWIDLADKAHNKTTRRLR